MSDWNEGTNAARNNASRPFDLEGQFAYDAERTRQALEQQRRDEEARQDQARQEQWRRDEEARQEQQRRDEEASRNT